MPPKGISNVFDRPCLVCSSQTRVAHLGIDVCRACSVFYRRAAKGNTYMCRTSNSECQLGPDLNCKRCRFDYIDRLLKQSSKVNDHSDSTNEQHTEPTNSALDQATFRQNSLDLGDGIVCSPSTSSIHSIRTELPILDRLKVHYRSMCRERLNGELHARPKPPHPLEISFEKGPYYPASFGSLSISNRILLTALLDFGTCIFPELAHFPIKERWDITVNLLFPFRQFEGFYRACAVFPDDLDKTFVAYTTWFSPNCMDNFYGDAPTGNIEAAQEYMKHSSLRVYEIRATRELLQRANLCHEEFLVLLALMFWAFGDLSVGDEMTQLGERYRESIMKELHAFYREHLRLDDYATRLGELMLLLPVFDRAKDMKEHFEMLRLLNVLPEDHFTYQLQKAE